MKEHRQTRRGMRATMPAVATGYEHRLYAESLSEFGNPLELANAGGWILQRQTPVSGLQDAMGCYPLFCCHDWHRLHDDFKKLENKIVCLSLVADPFGNYSPDLLRSLFEVAIPFKQHFVADLELPLEEFTSARHRKYARHALQKVTVEICSDPPSQLDEWVRLYDHLIERRHITGMRRFSRESFARQLAVPGMVMFRGSAGRETVILDLWYVQGDVAQAHLVGTSPRGYELQASYATKLFILQHFTGKVRWANLGAVPGAKDDAVDGLTTFKSGWSSGTRTAYFCGKIFNPKAYQELVGVTRSEGTSFFPAYRKGEFSSPVNGTAN